MTCFFKYLFSFHFKKFISFLFFVVVVLRKYYKYKNTLHDKKKRIYTYINKLNRFVAKLKNFWKIKSFLKIDTNENSLFSFLLLSWSIDRSRTQIIYNKNVFYNTSATCYIFIYNFLFLIVYCLLFTVRAFIQFKRKLLVKSLINKIK